MRTRSMAAKAAEQQPPEPQPRLQAPSSGPTLSLRTASPPLSASARVVSQPDLMQLEQLALDVGELSISSCYRYRMQPFMLVCKLWFRLTAALLRTHVYVAIAGASEEIDEGGSDAEAPDQLGQLEYHGSLIYYYYRHEEQAHLSAQLVSSCLRTAGCEMAEQNAADYLGQFPRLEALYWHMHEYDVYDNRIIGSAFRCLAPFAHLLRSLELYQSNLSLLADLLAHTPALEDLCLNEHSTADDIAALPDIGLSRLKSLRMLHFNAERRGFDGEFVVERQAEAQANWIWLLSIGQKHLRRLELDEESEGPGFHAVFRTMSFPSLDELHIRRLDHFLGKGGASAALPPPCKHLFIQAMLPTPQREDQAVFLSSVNHFEHLPAYLGQSRCQSVDLIFREGPSSIASYLVREVCRLFVAVQPLVDGEKGLRVTVKWQNGLSWPIFHTLIDFLNYISYRGWVPPPDMRDMPFFSTEASRATWHARMKHWNSVDRLIYTPLLCASTSTTHTYPLMRQVWRLNDVYDESRAAGAVARERRAHEHDQYPSDGKTMWPRDIDNEPRTDFHPPPRRSWLNDASD